MSDETPDKSPKTQSPDRSEPVEATEPLARDRPSIRARRAAADTLVEVLSGGMALETALMRQPDMEGLEPRDRAFARAIAATYFRRSAQIDAALKPFLRKPPPDFTRAVLRTAAAQILFMDTPPHAAVGESVTVLKSRRAGKGFAGMGNAVLRKVVAEGPKLAGMIAPRQNFPGWLRGSWERSYGRSALRGMGLALMKDPVLDLTVPKDIEHWAKTLDGTIIGPQTVRLSSIGDVRALPGFEEGVWWAQDVAAALPVQMLGQTMNLKGARVLDLCAAPGGKTLQLYAAGAKVTALDKSESRLTRVHENLSRTGYSADVICADALAYTPDTLFDAVLLDAPCSATGTFRRHPDVLHNRTPKTVAQLVRLQDKMLKAAASMVRPGGTLLFATCSLQPEEGAPRIVKFLETLPEFRLISGLEPILPSLGVGDLPSGMVRTLPSDLSDQGGADGFFMAALQRAQ